MEKLNLAQRLIKSHLLRVTMEPGNDISHEVQMERFEKPGKLKIG
jgi:hypothetical protein